MSKEIPGVFHDDPKMTLEDLEKIDILSENECEAKWSKYVSAVNRHFMKLDDDEWPAKIVSKNQCWYHWLDDWNNDDFSKFSSLLQSLDIREESGIIVFWMKEIGLYTSWEVFRNNWGNFLYEDEGCILVVPGQEQSLVLSNGAVWLGERSAPKT